MTVEKVPGQRRTSWNLGPLFRSDDDPSVEKKRKFVEQKSYAFINKWKNRKDYLEDPRILRQALDEYQEWKRECGTDGDEGYYFFLRTQQDKNNPRLKAKYNKIEEFRKKIENDIQFFQLRIAKIRRKNHKKFLESRELGPYRHFVERIFAEAKYLLSEPEEKILNCKISTSYYNWIKLTSGLLVRESRKVLAESGLKEEKNFSEIISLLNSRKKKVRDSAARAFNDILSRHVDVAEAELNAVLANKKIDDELRGVDRPDLTRHISDDIDSDIVDSLVAAVSERFDIPVRFYELKTRLFKVRRLRYHERNVEYGEISRTCTYNESIRLVSRVLRNLDGKFVEILDAFIKNSHIDVFPRKGKASGAFCAHNLISQPTFILLNHTEKLQDVLTLAHELGHGINNELMREKQNSLNFGTPLSTAEVASTFFEDFVLQEILKDADDELKCSILIKKLDNDVSTIFRQVACYRFEQDLHEEFRKKGYLSKHEIGKLFQSHMAGYMGDFVEQSPGSENWWIYWSHIRIFFYVYSYASGLLISKSLQNAVKSDPVFIEKVKGFLSAGLSDSPKNIFRKLGIDIADRGFWNKGIDEVDNLLQETTLLAKRLGKI
jgi:oligoendopeptidase F